MYYIGVKSALFIVGKNSFYRVSKLYYSVSYRESINCQFRFVHTDFFGVRSVFFLTSPLLQCRCSSVVRFHFSRASSWLFVLFVCCSLLLSPCFTLVCFGVRSEFNSLCFPFASMSISVIDSLEFLWNFR